MNSRSEPETTRSYAFSSFDDHSVSTVLSGLILYSADRSTPVVSVVVTGAMTFVGVAVTGFGRGWRPPWWDSVTGMWIGGATTAGVWLWVAVVVEATRFATLPPSAAA